MGSRLVSAFILIPLALGIIYLGGWAYLTLLILLAWLLAVEWCRVMAPTSVKPFSLALGGAVTAALILTRFGYILPGLAALTVMAAGLIVATKGRDARGAWLGFGVLYIGIGLMGAEWIMTFLPEGRGVIVWTLLVIWATDTGAMTIGRLLGGPKLAPRLSPKKTWSGALGGLAAGTVIGGLAGPWLYPAGGGVTLSLAAGAAIVGQLGDLLESGIKRHFGIKDFSDLIPGHGGVFDRLDSLLCVMPVVALASAVLSGAVLSGIAAW